jgi:hypothetical protein
MRVAERIDRDAAAEIQIPLAVAGDQPNALTAFKREINAGISRQKVRRHGSGSLF